MKRKSKSTKKYPVGHKFKYLTILEYTINEVPYRIKCQCVCGKIKEFNLSNVVPKPNARYTHSCGCKRGGLVAAKVSTHGLSGKKFYRHWCAMKNRMLPKYINADSYIGIKVCERWQNFENFKADMFESWQAHEAEHGGRETTLERKDVNKGYSPENCRWATQKEQSRNKKDTVFVEFQGKRMSLADACELAGKKHDAVYHRIKNGYTFEQAITAKKWERVNHA
jgi:hypothetical protein